MIHAWILKGQQSLLLKYLKKAIFLSFVMQVPWFGGCNYSIV